MRKTNLLLAVSILISGCTKTAPADFYSYNTAVAWDAALLLDMECKDYINSFSCYDKQEEAKQRLKSIVPKLYEININKLNCILELSQNDKKHDFSGELLDFIEDHNLKYNTTELVMVEWFKSYECD